MGRLVLIGSGLSLSSRGPVCGEVLVQYRLSSVKLMFLQKKQKPEKKKKSFISPEEEEDDEEARLQVIALSDIRLFSSSVVLKQGVLCRPRPLS